jgi:hypothetical protein
MRKVTVPVFASLIARITGRRGRRKPGSSRMPERLPDAGE